MPTFPFMQVDAFTTQRLAGNPCAIVFEADGLEDETMLAIAREMNLSETSFVVQSDRANYGARYFTPSVEIPLAGHPTVATVFGLAETNRLQLSGDYTTISLELTAGVIQVEVHAQKGEVTRVTMSQKKPQFLAAFSRDEVLPLFSLSSEDILAGYPLQVVSTGTPQLMIPVKSLDILRQVQPDLVAYEAFKQPNNISSAHLFCLGGVTEVGDTFARNFDTPPDIIEDPFTGSATGGMAAYLWHYGLIDTPEFVAEQGHWVNRPGQAYVTIVGPRDNIETVKVGGAAVTVVRGELVL